MLHATWAMPVQGIFLFDCLEDYKEAQRKGSYMHFWPVLYKNWEKEYPTHEEILPGQDLSNITEGDQKRLQEGIKERCNIHYNLKSWLDTLVTPTLATPDLVLVEM
jgi:hypothetical protein